MGRHRPGAWSACARQVMIAIMGPRMIKSGPHLTFDSSLTCLRSALIPKRPVPVAMFGG